MTGCQCVQHCRYPTVGDPEVREQHRIAHVAFALWAADRTDRVGFTAPSPSALVRIVAGEWSDVPRSCPRVEDIGKPAHPVHRA